jgi:hypothetical protein
MILISSDFVYLPIAFAVIPDLQQTVLGVMTLSALGAFQVTAPGCALPIVVFGDGKSRPAAARNQKHFQTFAFVGGHFSEYTIQDFRFLR